MTVSEWSRRVKPAVVKCLAAVMLLITCLVKAQDLNQGAAINQIRIIGVTVFEPSELMQLTEGIAGSTVYVEDLIDLTAAITALYVDAGYITSGAYLPEQEVNNEILTINVTEGELQEIRLGSTGNYSEDYLRERVRRQIQSPFNIAQLQAALTELDEDVRIESVTGEIIPGSQRGDAILELNIVETDPLQVMLATNNYLSPSIGSEQLQISANHLNLTGRADELSVSLARSDGFEAGSISYLVPLSVQDSSVRFYYSAGDTVVVEEPFDRIDIRSDTDTAGFTLTNRFSLGSGLMLDAFAGLEKKHSEASLLGEGFDFSPGSQRGLARASIAYAGVRFSHRGREQAWSTGATWRHGLDIWDATTLPGLPDGEFDILVVQGEYLQRVADLGTLSLRINSQFSTDTLQSFERLTLGGHNSVRGYRQNRVLKDNGWELLLDFEIPVFRNYPDIGVQFSVIPSFGHGRVWDSEQAPNIDRDATLSSAGISLQARAERWTARLDWAQRLSSKNKLGDELQDDGIYLGVSYGF